MSTHSTTITKTPGVLPVPDDAADKSHHVRGSNGEVVKFRNPHPSYHGVDPWMAVRKILIPQFTGKIKLPDTTPPTVPVSPPNFLASRKSSSKLRATWLGHACYYVEFPSGLRVLFDPVFEDRCSPFSFMGPKRFTQPPCKVDEIPLVDAVVISHSHYDHLSHTSVVTLAKKHPRAHFFVGMGLAKWFKSTGVKNVTEMDWWEDVEFKLTPEDKDPGDAAADEIKATVSALPCQHTSARGLFDRDCTLWCSWAINSGGKKVWFGGDTGYRAVPEVPEGEDDWSEKYLSLPKTPQFKQIGDCRGPFHLGLIPIGAYSPRIFMSPMHANPYDAVEIFADTKCEKALGIHWGTWTLTYEEVMEPPQMLKEALRKKGLPDTGTFDVCDIGESREFE
ncbi:NAPE-hydrolyzing phospholipase D [Zalerion maritima]|uniref:NAPE-hydrolyzing phospholipase D n=1 Tax=Zalerion maritima TaxID=339359 RepID=A0AAD5RW96_9PEZI|nr:NAPE-hydrolyzing phospholipase D [Zalerion maritima]